MRRRAFIAALGGAAVWPLVARAQRLTKIPTVGFLYPGPQAVGPPRIAAFLAGLRAGGYREKEQVEAIPRLWIILSAVVAVMFSTLLALGWHIYQQAPPIPESVRSQSGQVIYTGENITTGEQVWQSIGGMQQGSIWGHSLPPTLARSSDE